MFVQVIMGPVSDAGELRASLDRWMRDLAPGATGWLGSTAGVTDDGLAIAFARFESAEAARRNSERPEQHQWWMETSKVFTGEITFHDCDKALTWLGGGSDDAGFVQVMTGLMTDPQRGAELLDTDPAPLKAFRPEIIGSVVAPNPDNTFTEAVYFTSEAEAREGEHKEMPPDLKAQFEEQMSLIQDMKFYDLHDPWMHSPR